MWFWLLICGVAMASRPIVLFHGLGDSCCNERIDRFISTLSKLLPSNHTTTTTFYSVMIGANPQEDRRHSYFDDANRQVHLVCRQLLKRQTADGFDAIGFSQGGLLLRAAVVRCAGVRWGRLVTLGSPHAGIESAPGCPRDDSVDRWCEVVKRVVESGAYSPLVRNRVIPAQYYRNPMELGKYYKYNRFLADINQEVRVNKDYKQRFLGLERFVMYKFSNDTVLEPSETAWFGWGDPELALVHSRTGLRELMEMGRVERKIAVGRYMRIAPSTIQSIAKDLQ